jgi:positive regulator of sigma E activity
LFIGYYWWYNNSKWDKANYYDHRGENDMRKIADILEVTDKDTAKIMLYKHKKCHGCGSCNKHMHPGSIFPASNPIQAKQGDMVSVNVHKKFSMTELSIVYLLPLAAFFGGLFAGGVLIPGKNGGAFSVGLAFVMLFASIAVNVAYRRKYHPDYTVSIAKVIQPAEPKL